jgi:hypothetical protein
MSIVRPHGGFSSREGDEIEALGAELLRDTVGVRKLRGAAKVRESDEGDKGTP